MADQKLQLSRAIAVVPSDTIDIPQPETKVASGAQTSATPNKLTDSGATFDDGAIKVGDIVHDTTSGAMGIATVTAIDSGTVLSISADIFTGTENYVIYRKSTTDCAWYVGVSGDVQVLTTGNDTVLLKAVPVGWQPINIKRVDSTNTTATDIVAGW
jgi:hypothetical protein